MAAAMAVGLIAFLGCGGVKEDPDAVTNAEKEDVIIVIIVIIVCHCIPTLS